MDNYTKFGKYGNLVNEVPSVFGDESESYIEQLHHLKETALHEPPSDGQMYVQKDGEWVPVTIDSSKFKGSYISLDELIAAHPTANDGDYAFVGTEGTDAQMFIWDINDSKWVSGGVTTVTPDTVQMMYESNPDIVRFSVAKDVTLSGKADKTELEDKANTSDVNRLRTDVDEEIRIIRTVTQSGLDGKVDNSRVVSEGIVPDTVPVRTSVGGIRVPQYLADQKTQDGWASNAASITTTGLHSYGTQNGFQWVRYLTGDWIFRKKITYYIRFMATAISGLWYNPIPMVNFTPPFELNEWWIGEIEISPTSHNLTFFSGIQRKTDGAVTVFAISPSDLSGVDITATIHVKINGVSERLIP